MNTDERLRLLLTAPTETLKVVDAALSGTPELERPSLRLLRMGQAAKETTVSRCTLWRAIRDGRLKAIEVRKGSFRVSECELRRFAGV